jgi:beta-lactamase regulating signal transducer with metallopeptidase domain
MDINAISTLIPEGLSNFSQSTAAALITEVWQGVVIAACLAACLKLAPRTTAAHRFGIWAAGFVTVAGLPFLPLLSHLAFGSALHLAANAATSSVRPWLQVDARWSLALTALWIVASLLRTIDLAVHTRHLRKLWKSARPVELSSAAIPSALSISGRKTALLCTTTMLERPGVIGFLAPRILIPEWLFARLSPAELDQIVLHETEHLRRGDDWTNLLQKLALVLFPLSPALLWMERRLCIEREMACDEGVVRRTNAPRAYAECLTSLAERGLEHRTQGLALGALSLGAWQRRPELVRRVHSILRGKSVLHPVAARSLMAVLGCSLLLGSAGLARCPQMVAFSPSAEAESAHVQGLAQYTPAVDPAFTSLRTVAVQTSAHGPQAEPYLTELKATMPGRAQSSPVRLVGKMAEPHASSARQPIVPKFSKPAVREEMLKADLSTSQTAPQTDAAAGQGQDTNQGWIVLTTWEQVQTSGQSDQSDQSVTSDEANAQLSKQNSGQTNAQITITRLIFRVIPANSKSTATGQLRAGWLVFQL